MMEAMGGGINAIIKQGFDKQNTELLFFASVSSLNTWQPGLVVQHVLTEDNNNTPDKTSDLNQDWKTPKSAGWTMTLLF